MSDVHLNRTHRPVEYPCRLVLAGAPPQVGMQLNQQLVEDIIDTHSSRLQLIPHPVFGDVLADWRHHPGYMTNRQGDGRVDCTHFCMPSPTLNWVVLSLLVEAVKSGGHSVDGSSRQRFPPLADCYSQARRAEVPGK